MAISLKVLAPNKNVYQGEAEEVILPSTTGQLGILPGHISLVTAIDIGVLRLRMNSQWKSIALMGGFAEIFTGMSGKYVKLEDTIAGFNMILSGELDDLPEQAFYLVGNIDEVKAKAEKIKSEK